MRSSKFVRCVAAFSAAALIFGNIHGDIFLTKVYADEVSVSVDAEEDVDLSKAEDRTWDFGSDSLNETIQGKTYLYDNMFIDATADGAKAAPNGEQWTQVNTGTKFYFPVKGDAVITLKAYNEDAEQFEINGEKFEVSGSWNPYEYTYEHKGEAKVIELDVLKNTYFESLSVKHMDEPGSESGSESGDSGNKEEAGNTKDSGDYSSKFEYPVEYNVWDFTDYDAIKNDAERLEGKDGFFHSLYVDARKGKFNPRENGGTDDAQVNAGTKIVVPLNKSTNGKAEIKVKYTQGAITINGEEYSSGSSYSYEYAGYGYAVIECAANTYIYSISASYPKSVFDTQESGEIDVWDFGGEASDISGATNHISADQYEKAADLVAEYNKTKTDKTTGETVVVKTVSEAFAGNGRLVVDDLTLNYAAGDRIYTADGVGNTQPATVKKGKYTFEDGYSSNGYYYANGNGGSDRRYVEIANVKAGNIIDIYMDSKNSEETAHFVNTTSDQDEVFTVSTKPAKYEFIAQNDGTYKIYTETANNGKIDVFRVVRRTDTVVQGKVDFGSLSAPENYKIVLTDTASGEEKEAEVDTVNNKYAAYIKAGHTYKASIRNASGFAVTEDTSAVKAKESDAAVRTTHDISVESRATVMVSGRVTGFDEGFDTSKSGIIFRDNSGSEITALFDQDGNFTAELNADTENVISLYNCYDYALSGECVLKADSEKNVDLTVQKAEVYAVYGKLLNIPQDENVTKITFTNTADKQTYIGEVKDQKFSAELRNGTYTAAVDNAEFTTKTKIVVKDAFAEKDLYFNAEKTYTSVGSASDVYVGYADKELNFDSVQEAVDAITATRKGNDRITLHIAPGTYREQIVINTPNLTFKADDGNVKLTWYYGIGYVYYSAKEGYYDPEAAYNKQNKGSVDKWGASVHVKSNAKGFAADGITFENSFNRYVTEEEIADGAEASTDAYPDTKITLKRTAGTDVRTTAATERATALAVDATNTEFTNCTFLGSQDTLYTHKGTTGYFKNCTIAGNTDYIFGYGDYVFESCVLKYEGYSDANKKHAYITANRGEDAKYGYLFNNCVITGPSNGFSLSGNYLGRPWDAQAKVIFKNTNIVKDGLVLDQGWTSMSGRMPQDVSYREYDTEEAGKVVTQAKRVIKNKDKKTKQVISVADSGKIYDKEADLGFKADDYFDSWKPVSFVTDETEETITKGKAKDYQYYTVYFRDENGNDIIMPETHLGMVNSRVDAVSAADAIDGYTFVNGNDVTLTSSKVEDIICTYKKADAFYTVIQADRKSGKILAKKLCTGTYGAAISVDPASLERINGYRLCSRSVKTIVLKYASSNVVIFYYEAGEEDPAQSEEPAQPENPTQPEKPAQPENPTQPEKPAQPENPTQPEKPAQPVNPSQPEKAEDTVTSDLGNGVIVTRPVSLPYRGKKYSKNEDLGIIINYNGQTYTGKDVKLKVTGSKNVGTIKVHLKSIKGVKTSKKDFKGTESFDINIEAFKVTDSNIASKKVSKGKLKSIKVKINGKAKSVPKKMFSQEGNIVTFSGNFTGQITVE
ncbi:Pectinesterase [Lachnospiraceae bacterium]|nr:Pectinesterase [Lachnospiraceae bacterium]